MISILKSYTALPLTLPYSSTGQLLESFISETKKKNILEISSYKWEIAADHTKTLVVHISKPKNL